MQNVVSWDIMDEAERILTEEGSDHMKDFAYQVLDGQINERSGCYQDCIQTQSGKMVDLLRPAVNQIELEDIAAALSKICRFGGHSKFFYSVAEHSVLATRLALQSGENDVRSILMHDASEAYLGDVVKPLKINLQKYNEIEANMESVIRSRFSIPNEKLKVKYYDLAMLKIEKNALFSTNMLDKDGLGGIKEHNVEPQFWDCDTAENEFLNLAGQLGIK